MRREVPGWGRVLRQGLIVALCGVTLAVWGLYLTGWTLSYAAPGLTEGLDKGGPGFVLVGLTLLGASAAGASGIRLGIAVERWLRKKRR